MEKKENTPKKRQRTDNWLEEDKDLLKELVKERVQAIENKNTDTNTNKKKQAAWADLQSNFNLMCKGVHRTTLQLKSQWVVIKMCAKKEKAAKRQAIINTDGEPPWTIRVKDANDISSWLPHELNLDSNIKISEIHAEITDMPEESQLIKDNKNRVQNDSDDKETKCKDEEQIKKKTKKQKLSQPVPTNESVAAIAEVEMECRKELHLAQMENEKRKARNLDLKHEVLLQKLLYYESKNN